MSVKKKLMEEINKKAQKTKELRATYADRNNVEAYVYEFFRQVDRGRNLETNYHSQLALAESVLRNKMKTIDGFCRVEPHWVSADDGFPGIKGVTITWSAAYVTANGVEPNLYIDVTDMLFS